MVGGSLAFFGFFWQDLGVFLFLFAIACACFAYVKRLCVVAALSLVFALLYFVAHIALFAGAWLLDIC